MEERRLLAAQLFADGLGPSEVARRLAVRRQSAHAWRERWRRDGVAGLRSKGAAGPKQRLNAEQRAALAARWREACRKDGRGRAEWTLAEAVDWIEQHTGQRYHRGHVWRLLRHLEGDRRQPGHRDKPGAHA